MSSGVAETLLASTLSARDRLTISVVVPCFNEEAVIEVSHAGLTATLKAIDHTYELIYVNDGSKDSTLDKLKEIQSKDTHVKIVCLSRNFGHQVAISAGLEVTRGDAVVIIDADLQDPPVLISKMIERWQQGFQVVYGRRLSRGGESHFKIFTAKWFYRALNALAEVSIPSDVGDFRLLDRRVVEAIRMMPERARFMRGMVSWVGFRQCAIDYQREPRFAGITKYPLRRMARLASDGILSFSVAPLRVASWIGLSVTGLSFLGMIYAIALRLLTNKWVPGYTLMFVSILFLGGIQMLFLGVLGEYVGRIFTESKGRPLYFVAEYIGFPETERENAV